MRCSRLALLVGLVYGALVAACGRDADVETSAGSASQATTSDGGLCARWPQAADTFDASAMTGCSPKAAFEGTAGNPCDGGSEYALSCNRASPDPALGCRVGATSPAGPAYCCPCRP